MSDAGDNREVVAMPLEATGYKGRPGAERARKTQTSFRPCPSTLGSITVEVQAMYTSEEFSTDEVAAPATTTIHHPYQERNR